MIFATSDLHGYSLDAFLSLLDRAGFSPSDLYLTEQIAKQEKY